MAVVTSKAVWRRALYERQKPGGGGSARRQPETAFDCNGMQQPSGRPRPWTVRLVAEEAVERKLVPRVGRETIRILLLSLDLKPRREKNVGGGRPG